MTIFWEKRGEVVPSAQGNPFFSTLAMIKKKILAPELFFFLLAPEFHRIEVISPAIICNVISSYKQKYLMVNNEH